MYMERKDFKNFKELPLTSPTPTCVRVILLESKFYHLNILKKVMFCNLV